MPVFDKNGLRIDASASGNILTFQVLHQDDEVVRILNILGGHVRDDQTGITLRSNEGPAFNRKIKRFFVRGSDTSKNNKVVRVEMASATEAQTAVEALNRLLDKIVAPSVPPPDKGFIDIGTARIMRGGTTHVRFAIINKKQAKHLVLTGHDHYPNKVIEWKPCEPVFTNSRHYNEHLGQVVDVLNKSVAEDVKVDGNIINPHRVTPQQARKAISAIREMFEKAEREDYLVAMWRVVTGIRGPDHVDKDVQCPECNHEFIIGA